VRKIFCWMPSLSLLIIIIPYINRYIATLFVLLIGV